MATAGQFAASSVSGHLELSTCLHIQMYIHVQYMDLKLYQFLPIVFSWVVASVVVDVVVGGPELKVMMYMFNMTKYIQGPF
jgi:hypothetical protein